jgi:RNA polymerase sigma-70 factor (ECF subfamily)
MSDIPDDIITRASRGDMAAFEQIYKATSGFVYNVALRVSGSPDAADEITQDVFVNVYRSLGRFGFRSSFRTWVYRIAANAAINHCKSSARRRYREVEYDPVSHDVAAPDDTLRPIEAAEAAEAVERLLGCLDPDQRACIVLREIEGLDYRSIAETLGVKINTVRTRIRRSREKLLALGGKGCRRCVAN